MNKLAFLLGMTTILMFTACGQPSIEKVLEKYNEGSVDYINVAELNDSRPRYILDTREKEEFEVSHIPGAIWVGYETFSIDEIPSLVKNNDASIVVYCSVGVRSEDIGEALIDNNYPNVRNLYGGIFEWKNQGLKVIDSTGNETQNVHAYSKFWGRLLTEANKVY